MGKFRRLNAKGTEKFRNFYSEKVEGSSFPAPTSLLTDEKYSEPVNRAKSVEQSSFSSRYEFGKYLCKVTEDCIGTEISNDEGIWNWFTLFYFDQLYPSPRGGKQIDRYLLNTHDRRRWYRHLVRTNWDLLSTHGEVAKFLLTSKINAFGDEIEQLISSQFIASNVNLLGAASKLYYKKGAGSNVGNIKTKARDTKAENGNIRRFVILAQQLELTYDLNSATTEHILELLPGEFDEWKPASSSA